MSSQDELDKDREVIAAATAGPWEAGGFTAESTRREMMGSSAGNAVNNQIFIARARTRYPELVEEVTRLRDILSHRDELPNVCPVCADAGFEPSRVHWDGHTLRCPKCGADAMEGE